MTESITWEDSASDHPLGEPAIVRAAWQYQGQVDVGGRAPESRTWDRGLDGHGEGTATARQGHQAAREGKKKKGVECGYRPRDAAPSLTRRWFRTCSAGRALFPASPSESTGRSRHLQCAITSYDCAAVLVRAHGQSPVGDRALVCARTDRPIHSRR